MYTKEEAKEIRLEFWDRFRKMTAGKRNKAGMPGNWILTRTGIRALNLRFHVDSTVAQVGIDLETRNMDKRLALYEKLESVQKILEEYVDGSMIWDIDYIRENGKAVSRIYVQLEGINIYDRSTWQDAHRFMYDKMMKLEEFYREYGDFLKYG